MSRDNSRRTRGSDGRLYDPKKQADRGHQAHESRVETVARRTRWRGEQVYDRAVELLFNSLFFLFVTLPMRVLGVVADGITMIVNGLGSARSQTRRRGR